MYSLRERLRVAYFKSKLVRHMTRWLAYDERRPIDFSHILSFHEEQIGPVHGDEALLLFALTRVLRPQTIVEFGFRSGHSAFNFLQAAGPDCRVFSYDVAGRSEDIARRCFSHFKNFQFIKKSQIAFLPSDIENRTIDLCFIDASHDTEMNLRTFELILPHLTERAIVAVHDTGVWHRKFFSDRHFAYSYSEVGATIGRWLDNERYQPAVTERLFVNTVLRKCPEFSQIHIHSAHTMRNGMTLLQRESPLITGPNPELTTSSSLYP